MHGRSHLVVHSRIGPNSIANFSSASPLIGLDLCSLNALHSRALALRRRQEHGEERDGERLGVPARQLEEVHRRPSSNEGAAPSSPPSLPRLTAFSAPRSSAGAPAASSATRSRRSTTRSTSSSAAARSSSTRARGMTRTSCTSTTTPCRSTSSTPPSATTSTSPSRAASPSPA